VFLTEGDGKTAFEYCQKAAEKGHKKAQVLLPIIQNFVIASQGDATAQCYVGMYYEEGNEFIKQNLEKAESWYKKAMLNGNQNAAVLLSGVQMKLNNKESEAQRQAMERMKREMESMREESERNRDAAEKSLAEAVKDGADVRLKVEPKYEGDSARPSEFKVSYTIDGDKEVVVFRNESEAMS
jgi:TPR repeat protein